MNITPKTKKGLMIGGAIVVLAILFYIGRKKGWFKKKDALADALEKETPLEEKKKTEAELIAEVENDSVFPLKVGKEGKRVEQLQKYILSECDKDALPVHNVDGIFGNETMSACLKCFQRDNVSKELFIRKKIYNY